MRKIALSIAVLGTILLPVLCTVPAHAQATRTWVSGVGDDANPCSRTAPCLTFAGAITKTAAGGEIDALDPGGFGGLTITKSITIDGGGGQVASVMVSGNTGILVSAGATDIVTIRNVQFQGDLGNGSNGGGGVGIGFNSGAMLSIDNCKFDGFTSGAILANPSANAILNVTNTIITNANYGILLNPSGGALNGSIDHTTIRKMSTYGIVAGGSVYFTVTNSAIVNAAMDGVTVSTGTVLEVDSSSVTNNNTAFATQGGIIRISRNTIYDNNTNFSISGGTIATGGNNFVAVNGSQAPNGSITQQ
jgi:Right handed beta helix region